MIHNSIASTQRLNQTKIFSLISRRLVNEENPSKHELWQYQLQLIIAVQKRPISLSKHFQTETHLEHVEVASECVVKRLLVFWTKYVRLEEFQEAQHFDVEGHVVP